MKDIGIIQARTADYSDFDHWLCLHPLSIAFHIGNNPYFLKDMAGGVNGGHVAPMEKMIGSILKL
jgi:hypothetical protein